MDLVGIAKDKWHSSNIRRSTISRFWTKSLRKRNATTWTISEFLSYSLVQGFKMMMMTFQAIQKMKMSLIQRTEVKKVKTIRVEECWSLVITQKMMKVIQMTMIVKVKMRMKVKTRIIWVIKERKCKELVHKGLLRTETKIIIKEV
jgi:hypothetical protein